MRKTTGWFALAALLLAAPAARPAHAADAVSDTPWLGVYTQTVDDQLREAMDLIGDGALVSRVTDDSPADRAGLQKGDIITRFASRPVRSADELVRMVRDSHVGQNVTVEVRRGTETRVLTVRLDPRPSDFGAPQADERQPSVREESGDGPGERRIIVRGGTPGAKTQRIIIRRQGGDDHEIQLPDLEGLRDLPQMRRFRVETPTPPTPPSGAAHMMVMGLGRGRLGVQVQDLNEQLGEYFEVPGGRGALVMEVLKDTPAQRVGLRAGDVITRVGDRTIESSSDLIEALQGQEGRVRVTFVRKGQTQTLEPELEPSAARRMRTELEGDRPAPEAPRAERDQLNDLRDQLRQMREELRRMRSEMESDRK